MEQDDLTVRPIAGREELTLFSRLPYVFNEELADDLAAGRRRPEWMWVAVRGGRLLARLAWWRQAGDGAPFLLDIFDIDDSSQDRDRLDIGVLLLRTAMAEVVPAVTHPPEYLAAQDVPRIRAATDLANIPVASAFRRLGYVNFERTINLIWP